MVKIQSDIFVVCGFLVCSLLSGGYIYFRTKSDYDSMGDYDVPLLAFINIASSLAGLFATITLKPPTNRQGVLYDVSAELDALPAVVQ